MRVKHISTYTTKVQFFFHHPPNTIVIFPILEQIQSLISKNTPYFLNYAIQTLNSLLNVIYWWSLCANAKVRKMFIAGCALQKDTCENKTKQQNDVIIIRLSSNQFRTRK